MALVYQVDMVLRFVGYTPKEIEEMDLESIHRVLAFKELIIGIIGETVQRVVEGFQGPGGAHSMPQTPQMDYTTHLNNPFVSPDFG